MFRDFKILALVGIAIFSAVNAEAKMVTLKSSKSEYIIRTFGVGRGTSELHFSSQRNPGYVAYVYVAGRKEDLSSFFYNFEHAKVVRCDARLYGPGNEHGSGTRCIDFQFEF